MEHKTRLAKVDDDYEPQDFMEAFLLEMRRGNETYTGNHKISSPPTVYQLLIIPYEFMHFFERPTESW